ncbi:MAG: DUF6171 family protein [Lachnospiraceae bacterium]|nr:DUF6171 family protein [Lachnospiraceae bacterium]
MNKKDDGSVSGSLRFCKMCEIYADIPEDIGLYADRLYALLEKNERADKELMDSRLKVCEDCIKNNQGTCLCCGCYCVIRSMKKSSHCPLEKW